MTYTYKEIESIFNQDILGFCKPDSNELILAIKRIDECCFEVTFDLNTDEFQSVIAIRRYYKNGDIEEIKDTEV